MFYSLKKGNFQTKAANKLKNSTFLADIQL